MSFPDVSNPVWAVLLILNGVVVGWLLAWVLRSKKSGSRAESVPKHGRLSFAQEGEDLLLEKIFSGQAEGFYVDVGAHHPVKFSNTSRLYQQGWHGLNIDPRPGTQELFDAARPCDINLGVGIDEEEGTLTYIQFNEPALNTFDRALAEERLRQRPGEWRIIAETPVPVRPLAAVLAEHVPAGTVIDLLTIDAEGWDLRVLRSNDWARFRPRVVLVESGGASLEEDLHGAEARLLAQHGYVLLGKTFRTLLFRLRSP